MNNKTAKVSIVIPIFNAENFLHETIASVLAQSYHYWELLLVDDGSTDRSVQIGRQYAAQYPARIRYLEHPNHENHGVCTSRNLGVLHAKGSYIAFLDADDVWLPHKLEHQVGILETHTEVGMVYSMSRYWRSWEQPIGKFNRDYNPHPKLKTNKLYPPRVLSVICYPLGKAQAPCPSNILLRKSVVEAIGGFEEAFQKSHQLYEDQAFLSKVYLTTSVYVSNECLDYYRLHKDSCMATTKNYREIREFFLTWFESYLVENSIDEPRIWRALNRAKWPYEHPYLHSLLTYPNSAINQIKLWARNTVFPTL